MKIKIVSKGSPLTTKIMNEKGEIIEGVTKVNWHCSIEGLAKVEMELIGVEVDLIGEYGE